MNDRPTTPKPETDESPKVGSDLSAASCSLPLSIMVLVPSGTHKPSSWTDYHRRAVTMKGLIKELNRELKLGRIVATRFIYKEEIRYGYFPENVKVRRPKGRLR